MMKDQSPFGLDFEVEGSRVELQIGLITPDVILPADEVAVIEEVYRNSDPVNKAVIFSEPMDEDDPTSPEVFINADDWGRLLGFPPGRNPSLSEAQDWLVWNEQKLAADVWAALQDYRRRQPAPSQPAPPVRQAAPVATSGGPKA